MVRCRLPVVIQKLYRVMCIQLQATSFRATKRAKSAIQAKRECGRRGNKKQQVTYPQSIQLIVPRPFTSWATLDSNLSELSAAAAGRNKKKSHQQHYYSTEKNTMVHSFVLKHWNFFSNLKRLLREGSAKSSVNQKKRWLQLQQGAPSHLTPP